MARKRLLVLSAENLKKVHMVIPFLDLQSSPYAELKDELDAAYRRVMEFIWYILGESCHG
jgi:hypothetical protein